MDIVVFTDGSCMSSGSTCNYGGIGIHFPNKELDDISEPFLLRPITNQRAELYAINKAISAIIDGLKFKTITIYTDSEYSIKSLTVWVHSWVKNNWKTANKQSVKNKDIIESIYNLIKKFPSRIKFIHVRAHTGKKDSLSIGNEVADKLATTGSKNSKAVIQKFTKKSKSKIVIDTSNILDESSNSSSDKSEEIDVIIKKDKTRRKRIFIDV